MTSTGVFASGGIVEFAASLQGAGTDPVDTVLVRDGVVHGTMHALDSMAQVRVNYHPISDAASQDQATFDTIEASPATNAWYQMGASPLGEWPLTMRADGDPYKLRVRVGGACSGTGAVCRIRVVIAPADSFGRTYVDQDLDSIMEAVFTNTTIAWGTQASQGTSGSAVLCTISQDQADLWRREQSVYDAVSSPAAGRTTTQVLVAASVWAKTDTPASLPRLHALHIMEYVG